MVTVEKLGGQWVIVRGSGLPASGEADGSAAAEESASSSQREFWTGRHWSPHYGLARQFGSKEEAETYLALHRDEID